MTTNTPYLYELSSTVHPQGLRQCTSKAINVEGVKSLKKCKNFEYEDDYDKDATHIVCRHCWIEESTGHCELVLANN